LTHPNLEWLDVAFAGAARPRQTTRRLAATH